MSYVVSVQGKFGPLTLEAKVHEKVNSPREANFKEINENDQHPHGQKKNNTSSKLSLYTKTASLKNNDENASFLTARANEIMTKKVIVRSETTTIAQINKLFNEYSFRHILIENKDGNICGIISDRDILKGNALEQEMASNYMTDTVYFCLENSTIQDIARLMFDKKISCVPVANDKNILIGIITQSDILKYIFNHETIKNLKI